MLCKHNAITLYNFYQKLSIFFILKRLFYGFFNRIYSKNKDKIKCYTKDKKRYNIFTKTLAFFCFLKYILTEYIEYISKIMKKTC